MIIIVICGLEMILAKIVVTLVLRNAIACNTETSERLIKSFTDLG